MIKLPMATNISQISRFLDGLELKHLVDNDEQSIYLQITIEEDQTLNIFVELFNEGENLKLSIFNLIPDINSHGHKDKIFRALLSLARKSIVKYEFELTNQEIIAVVDLPLKDAPLTQLQFTSIFITMIQHILEIAIPYLREIVTTGVDRQERELGERLLLMLQEQTPKGMLDLLDSALVDRKARGNI